MSVRPPAAAGKAVRGARLAFAGIATLAATASAASAQQWMLLGRHGECVPVSSLKRKVPEAAELRTPEEFVRRMQAKGHLVQRASVAGTQGRAVEVKVPALELALVFAMHELCRGGAER